MNSSSRDLKLVYSVSDSGSLVKNLLRSIRSLRRFFGRDEVIVFYTPPRSEANYSRMAELAVVLEADNLTEEFNVGRRTGRFGDKFHALFVRSPNMVFLDADTLIRKDLIDLLYGDFDFSARVAPAYLEMDINIWNQMFLERGKTPIPMVNTGFMIFKNRLHNRIAEKVLQYMRQNLPNPHPHRYHKDQYAMSLAVSDVAKFRWMDKHVHNLLWHDDPVETFVSHGSSVRLGKQLRGLGKKLILRIEDNVPSLLH